MFEGFYDKLNSERGLVTVRVSGQGWSPGVEGLLSKHETLGFVLSTVNLQTNE